MSQPPRVLVIGGGGIGTLAAFNLEAGGHARVTLVLRSNYEAALRDGFTINSCDHGTHERWLPLGGIVQSIPDARDQTLPDSVSPFDWVICCTKNISDVGPKLEDIIRPSVTPGITTIILLQNGLGIEKLFLSAYPENICLSGISFCGVEELATCHILHKEADRLTISVFTNPAIDPEIQHGKAQEFVSLYAASGKAQVTFDADVQAVRWRKLLINAVYNPICALTDLDTSRLRLTSLLGEPNIIKELIRPAMHEVQAAALVVAGVNVTDEDIDSAIHGDSIKSFSMPSMQQDVQRGRFIEHEVILGEAVRMARSFGVDMPVINTLYHLCRALQFRTMERTGSIDVNELVESYTRDESQ